MLKSLNIKEKEIADESPFFLHSKHGDPEKEMCRMTYKITIDIRTLF
jgi:hypothetical protein